LPRHSPTAFCPYTTLFRSRRGFYVIVPPEYRVAGSLPAAWFIRDLMDYLRRPYYVGLLTAPSLHGAAHQAPQEFQVVTDRALGVDRKSTRLNSSHQLIWYA